MKWDNALKNQLKEKNKMYNSINEGNWEDHLLNQYLSDIEEQDKIEELEELEDKDEDES